MRLSSARRLIHSPQFLITFLDAILDLDPVPFGVMEGHVPRCAASPLPRALLPCPALSGSPGPAREHAPLSPPWSDHRGPAPGPATIDDVASPPAPMRLAGADPQRQLLGHGQRSSSGARCTTARQRTGLRHAVTGVRRYPLSVGLGRQPERQRTAPQQHLPARKGGFCPPPRSRGSCPISSSTPWEKLTPSSR